MLSFLPKPLVGGLAVLLYTLNLIYISVFLYIIGFFKLILRFKSAQNFLDNSIARLTVLWCKGHDLIMWLTTKTVWDIQGLEGINPKGRYLMLSNHQSWADIIVLFKVFHGKAPMLRYFLKRELIWVPLVGAACWISSFPFMNRYSREYLEKHPEKKGKDIEITHKACERFKDIPTTMINFAEGTRFTDAKHKRQKSPFQHLLKPKAGGAAFVIAAMGDILDGIIDVTIVYPKDESSAWDFFCGRHRKISVHARLLPLTDDLRGNYQADREFRVQFQKWINELWTDKDNLLEQLHRDSETSQ